MLLGCPSVDPDSYFSPSGIKAVVATQVDSSPDYRPYPMIVEGVPVPDMSGALLTMIFEHDEINTETMFSLGQKGFFLCFGFPWLVFSKRDSDGTLQLARAVRLGDLQPEIMQLLADEGLSLDTSPEKYMVWAKPVGESEVNGQES